MPTKTLLVLLVAAGLTVSGAAGIALGSWATTPAFADDDDDDRPRRSYRSRRAVKHVRRAQRVVRPRARPEIVAAGLSAADLDRLVSQGFTLVRQQPVGLLGTSLARLQIPPRLGLRRALRRAAATAPNGTFARNDLYRALPRVGYRPTGGGCGQRCEAFDLTAWTQSVGRCGVDVPIGVIDTGVDRDHPSLAGARITLRTTRSPDRPASEKDHGTAIVSLLVGQRDSDVVGVVPGAHVLAADAFHESGRDSSADVYDLIAAIDWLVSEQAKVLNLSLSGPDNVLLERAVATAQGRGAFLIAASGRPDRHQRTGYPARYRGVIAVSAVDHRYRMSRLATRGEHIAFVAPGVGVAVARRPTGVWRVDGTSFAAPFVSAAFAMGLGRGRSGPEMTELLRQSAKDLGSPGHDPIYGWGLVQYSAIPPC